MYNNTKENNNDPVFRQYQKFKSETSGKLFSRIHDLIKSFGNHIAISTYTHAGTDFYRKESNSHTALYDNFVENGGKLLATGFTSTRDEIGNPLDKIRLNSLGEESEFTAFEKEQGTYFKIFEKDKKELNETVFQGFDLVYAWEKGMLCEPKPGAKSLLGNIPPAMIGPPEKTYYTEVTDIPGLIAHEFGKGKTAFFPFRIGALYHPKIHYGHEALVMAALKNLLEFEPDVRTNASPLVEISRQKSKTGDFEWYAFLNHSGQFGNGFFKPLPIQNISLFFNPENPPQKIISLKSGAEVSFEAITGGMLKLMLPKLGAYDIILIEY